MTYHQYTSGAITDLEDARWTALLYYVDEL